MTHTNLIFSNLKPELVVYSRSIESGKIVYRNNGTVSSFDEQNRVLTTKQLTQNEICQLRDAIKSQEKYMIERALKDSEEFCKEREEAQIGF